MNLIEVKNLIEELTETKRQLAELQIELDKIYAAREKRKKAAEEKRKKVSPDDKIFQEILRCSLMRYSSQERQNVTMMNLIIKNMIIKKQFSNGKFFIRFNHVLSKLKNYQIFQDECTGYDSTAIAQHVAMGGDKAVNGIFKNGLISTFGKDNLQLMNKRIFSDEELDVEKHLDHEENEEFINEEVLND